MRAVSDKRAKGVTMEATQISASEALDRLKSGNAAYLEAKSNHGDIAPAVREKLVEQGQAPFACVISCSDSRVVPEHIFMAGLGELFCIRVAGNVVDAIELASALYAADHLHVPLIIVLGHTHCDAIEAACKVRANEVPAEGDALAPLAWSVIAGIGEETDPAAMAKSNALAGVERLMADPDIKRIVDEGKLEVHAALYQTDSGKVDFLEEL